jgi:hypothetical protein
VNLVKAAEIYLQKSFVQVSESEEFLSIGFKEVNEIIGKTVLFRSFLLEINLTGTGYRVGRISSQSKSRIGDWISGWILFESSNQRCGSGIFYPEFGSCYFFIPDSDPSIFSSLIPDATKK